MPYISDTNLGSLLLSTFILLGFIATAFVFIRLTIIGVNYVKENFSNVEDEAMKENHTKKEKKGF